MDDRKRMLPITAKGRVKPPTSYSAPPTTGPTISPANFSSLKIQYFSEEVFHTNAEEQFYHGKHGGNFVRELPSDGGETTREEHRVATSFEYPEDKGEPKEELAILHEAKTAVANKNDAHCADSQVQCFLTRISEISGSQKNSHIIELTVANCIEISMDYSEPRKRHLFIYADLKF